MSQAKLARTLCVLIEAFLRPELRGQLWRDWLDLDAHGLSEHIVESMWLLGLAGSVRAGAPSKAELRGCRMPDWRL
eukprot:9467773-Pyramimonas_sp.AAC.3